jgi:hypothetical protein
MPTVSRGRTYLSNCLKKLDGVKIGTVYTKWGNLDENLLNGVIAVKIFELGGKNWNLLFLPYQISDLLPCFLEGYRSRKLS